MTISVLPFAQYFPVFFSPSVWTSCFRESSVGVQPSKLATTKKICQINMSKCTLISLCLRLEFVLMMLSPHLVLILHYFFCCCSSPPLSVPYFSPSPFHCLSYASLPLHLFFSQFLLLLYFLKRDFENNRKSRRSVDLLTNLKTNVCRVSGSWKFFFLISSSLSFFSVFFFYSDTENIKIFGRS